MRHLFWCTAYRWRELGRYRFWLQTPGTSNRSGIYAIGWEWGRS